MLTNPFRKGDKVLVSRLETGENHEPATVIDSYELLIGAQTKPMIVVQFEDGEQRYVAATPPNVLPAPAEPEEAEEEGAEAAGEDAPEAGGTEGETAAADETSETAEAGGTAETADAGATGEPAEAPADAPAD